MPNTMHRCSPLLLTAVLALSTACDGQTRRTRHPGQDLVAAGWIDRAPLGGGAQSDPEQLAALGEAGIRGRILRLDRLIDLYDAARFATDQHARESLWLALGGHTSTRGIEASREAVIRMLDEAYAIEDLAAAQPQAIDEDEQRFVADAIMLLSTDMFLPDTAESLITATLAYRVLSEGGHPRIADNAHWRLYDHVRGVLAGAVEIGPGLRADIMVHALYAEREDISAWLEDLGPHARPPLPSPAELWALLEQQRDAVAAIDRWRDVVAARADADAALRDTIMALLPRPRDPSWRLAELPRGTGVPESLAPVLLLEPGRLRLEPGSDAPRDLDPRALEDAAITAIEGLLARDGRGIVLLASAPDVPAPETAASLGALAAARTTTIELAVHEPGLTDAGDDVPAAVVVALPLYVARPDDASAGARALRDSRIHVQLSGRGPRFRVDGRWLSATPTLPSDLIAMIDQLRRAYPRQHAISLTLGSDVQHQQLIDLLAALTGGRTPAFVAAGWLPDAAAEPELRGDPKADRALAARLALTGDALSLTAKLPEQLPELERARIVTAVESLRVCVPELEAALPKQGLTLQLEFADHQLVGLTASGRKLGRADLARVETCARDRLTGFRLREHDGPALVEVSVVRAASATDGDR